MKKYFYRAIAITALSIIYGFTIMLSGLGKYLVKDKSGKSNRIIINGTFHNPHWFLAHIAPVAMSGYGEVVLVSDVPLNELPNLRIIHPPKWALTLFTRAGAKAIWTLYAGIKYPADCFMGYHIFPSAITALLCARLTGSKAVYQITSGSVELEGGGWHGENALLSALGSESKLIENLALKITQSFDLVIVRGTNAKSFLLDTVGAIPLEIVTGSVVTDEKFLRPKNQRNIDVLFVGRLAETKRPDRFLNIMAKVVKKMPSCKISIAGDGPLRQALEIQADNLGLSNNVEFMGKRSDIPDIQGRSKIFALTSRSEGVSIAMLESMGLGCIPVVSDVGDLKDFVDQGENGYVCEQNDIDSFVTNIVSILEDDNLSDRLSHSARQTILTTADRAIVAHRWKLILDNLAIN